MKANATDLPPPTPVSVSASASASTEAVTALYRAHALGLIRLAVVMLGDRPAAEDVTFPKAGLLAVNVLWSNSSGGLLIGVIPTTGDGRVGVISGNTFTPLPGQGNSTADQSGAW